MDYPREVHSLWRQQTGVAFCSWVRAAVVVGVSLVIILVITLVWLLHRRTPVSRYRRTARDRRRMGGGGAT
jgi:nitrate reductase gamma subunit